MASLSSSSKPTGSGRGRAPSRSPTPSAPNRPSSPALVTQDTPALAAWRNALMAYRKSLSGKEFKRIQVPASPQDVIDEIEEWERKHSATKHAKVTKAIRGGSARLQKFNGSIDMLAQGSPSPACLLWGSIKFVLVIVQSAAEEYYKLCSALLRIIDCLPGVERYAETFLESEIVKNGIIAYYVSILRFWTRACKFYRRRRLFNAIRAVWSDFDVEFNELEVEMTRAQRQVESAALVEHIGQAKDFRLQQHSITLKILEAQVSARQKEITAWLAPLAYDVEYYSTDLANANTLRHPRTCHWILKKDEFIEFSGNTSLEGSILWVYAKPGAGKTILSSFLIEHQRDNRSDERSSHVLYFFCKSTDADKNSSTSIIRSLLYQLYAIIQSREGNEPLNYDLSFALDKSGQQKAMNFDTLWRLFSAHIDGISPVHIILDALDECQDSDILVQSLQLLASTHTVKVIVTSRKEAHLEKRLTDGLSLEITPEDINADIMAFVEAKVLASPRLSHGSVRDLVVTKLSQLHGGMFLWVHLTLRELKSCVSINQVREALVRLPKGLDGIYESISHRLRDTLSDAALDLCIQVLTWIVCAVRPLKINEIKQALELQYDREGDVLLSEDRSFPYSNKDLEHICGSLITARDGYLQVIHLTVKEFLKFSPLRDNSVRPSLFVDQTTANRQLTLTCLRCIKIHCSTPLVDLGSETHRMDMKINDDTISQRRLQAPFLEYAMISWITHLTDCAGGKDPAVIEIFQEFRETFESQSTFNWVEICMTFQPESVFRLLVGLEEVKDWISDLGHDDSSQVIASRTFLVNWCSALAELFEHYGAIVSKRPWEVHFLDLGDVFQILADYYRKYGLTKMRETSLRLQEYYPPQGPPMKSSRPHQLQLQGSGITSDNVFLIHDERRHLYFWGDIRGSPRIQRLYVQNALTGQRLPPAETLSELLGYYSTLQSRAMSPDGRYIGLVFNDGLWCDVTLIWQINEVLEFRRRLGCESWARIIFMHCSDFSFCGSEKSLVFSNDGYCLTPSGRVDLASGHLYPLEGALRNYLITTKLACYIQNGKLLFLSQGDEQSGYQAITVGPFESTFTVRCWWNEKTDRMIDVSPSGRFVVLEQASHGTLECQSLHLYDLQSRTTIYLPFPYPLCYRYAKYHFLKGSLTLVAFMQSRISDHNYLNVYVWDDIATQRKLRSHGKLKIDNGTGQIHVNEDEVSALIVSGALSIQPIEFHGNVTFPNAIDVNEDYLHSRSFLSDDGNSCALIHYGRTKGHLTFMELGSLKTRCCELGLSWPECNDPSDLCIAMSRDLSVLAVDEHIFDLADLGEDSGLIPFCIAGAPPVLAFHRRGEVAKGHELKCNISNCNSYIMFTNGGECEAVDEFPPALSVFRINLGSRRSTELRLELPRNVASISADFHPSRPLMLLSCVLATDHTMEEEERAVIQLCTLDLQNLELNPIALPTGPAFTQIYNAILHSQIDPDSIRIHISKSGTSAFLEAAARPSQVCQIIQTFDIQPTPIRYIRAASGSSLRDCVSIDEYSYIAFVKTSSNTMGLEYFKFSTEGFWGGYAPLKACLPNIAIHSLALAEADGYLLLGASDDEKMRLLHIPRDGRTPVIQTLSLSFADAKERLEKIWRDKFRYETTFEGEATSEDGRASEGAIAGERSSSSNKKTFAQGA